MSGLCGWFDLGRPDAANANIDAMAATLARFDGTPVRSKSAEWGAVATAARGANGDVFQDGHRLAAVCGRARFSDARLADLAQRQGVACALAEGYVQKGTEVLKVLAGSFSLAILDRSSGKALLAIDRMGTRALCYTTEGGKLVFGSTLDAIGAFPGSTHEISRQAIYDYVYFHMVPGPQTLYAHRERLLPGTFLTWDNGTRQTAPYWEMRFTEDEKRSFPDLKKEFLALVRESVEDAAQEGSTGTFLSGGTDSSTVAGMLREVTGEAPRTYSIGFDAHGFDEMSYARIAARHFETRHKEYYVTPDDVANAIPRIAAIHDQPFGNSSAVPTYYCAKLARDDGVDTLLGGDGGDELFGGNARYATQYLYSVYSDLPRPIRKTVIEPVVSLLPEAGMAGKARRYIATASMPMPARYDHYNLLERLGPGAVFTP
ncbi:MAG TPA: asparagine synthase-related protein, partial [Pseudoxanthomonas sp.]|nr:asparagine synthase-related protein [Pseudoxanthomonas sp.]